MPDLHESADVQCDTCGQYVSKDFTKLNDELETVCDDCSGEHDLQIIRDSKKICLYAKISKKVDSNTIEVILTTFMGMTQIIPYHVKISHKHKILSVKFKHENEDWHGRGKAYIDYALVICKRKKIKHIDNT